MSVLNDDLRFFQLDEKFIICFSRIGTFKLIYVEEISTGIRRVFNESGSEDEITTLALDIVKKWEATT